MANQSVYDSAYFLGTGKTRGEFDLIEVGPKYQSRWKYLERYLGKTLDDTDLSERNGRGWNVADIGAGAVNLARLLEKTRPQISIANVFSTDISRAGYDIVGGESPFFISDVHNLPIADSSMDLVVSWDLFEHLEDPGRGLDECTRVLRPGGVLHLVTPNPNSYKSGTDVDTYFRDQTHVNPPIISTDYFRTQLESLGYKNIEVVTRGFPESKEHAELHDGDDLFKPEGGTHIVVYAQKSGE